MEAEALASLINKYLENKASIEEINQLNAWYSSFDAKKDLYTADSSELHQIVAIRFSELILKLGITNPSVQTLSDKYC